MLKHMVYGENVKRGDFNYNSYSDNNNNRPRIIDVDGIRLVEVEKVKERGRVRCVQLPGIQWI